MEAGNTVEDGILVDADPDPKELASGMFVRSADAAVNSRAPGVNVAAPKFVGVGE